MTGLPLAGKRLLVTRAAHQAGKLSEGLRALGAEIVEVPVLEIQPPSSYDALDQALRAFDRYDWVLFTSANTVRAVVERATTLGVKLGLTGKAQVAAVGSATAAAARDAGFKASIVPESYVAESLIEALAGQVEGLHILLARAAVARDVIPEALRAAGAVVDVADAYRNALPADAPERLKSALAQQIDAVPFTSSSSVTHLAEAARKAGVAFPFVGVNAVSIGPITSATLRELGWEPAAEAEKSDVGGLVAATVQALL